VFGGRNRLSRRTHKVLLSSFGVAILGVAGCARTRPAAVAIPSPPPAATQPAPAPPAVFAPVLPSANAPAAAPPAGSAPALAPAPAYAEQGIASWYGAPFDGRRASDGEVYDMTLMVAAHRTLPFGSIVRVTNLNNGLQTEVRIIDRGPFVAGRIIDLSLAAARALNLVGPGTAPVRIELLSSPAPLGGDFTVQVGAFTVRENAERLRLQLSARFMPIFIQETNAPNGHFFRVRVGREPSQDAAQQLAATLKAQNSLQQTFVVRLDEVACCSMSAPAPSSSPAPASGGTLP
jgi:rare lipoprotein A